MKNQKVIVIDDGSTDGTAKLFVNGRHVPYLKVTAQPDKSTKSETLPEANGYCEPFSFDVTEAVKAAKGGQVEAVLLIQEFRHPV